MKEKITSKEILVLEYVSKGMTNKEIAGKMNISKETVKVYLKNLFLKLEVKNRVQMLVKALELRIIKI